MMLRIGLIVDYHSKNFTMLKRKKPNSDASALILILTKKNKPTIARTKKKKPTIAATPSGSLTVRNCFPDSKLQIRLELDLFVSIFSGPIPVLVDYNRVNYYLPELGMPWSGCINKCFKTDQFCTQRNRNKQKTI